MIVSPTGLAMAVTAVMTIFANTSFATPPAPPSTSITSSIPQQIAVRLIHPRNPLPQNPCFSPYDTPRQIDTIVIHHTSAAYWFDPAFQALLSDQIKTEVARRGITPANIPDHKFDPELNIRLFRTYGVSPHYLIGRNGEIIQLVQDNDMAYHAGVSAMPPPDGRTGVNYFSIGIELIASHPDDDPEIALHPETAYTEQQYAALQALVARLSRAHPIHAVVGHDEIAPDRKKDPGPLFDWPRIRHADRTPRLDSGSTDGDSLSP